MAFPLKLAFTLVALAFPVLEIALLIKAGGVLGFWPVFLIVLATAVAGTMVIRARGISVLSKVFADVEAGGSGFAAMADAFLAALGGVLLILPGLLCDGIGVLLLLPPVRGLLIKGGLSGVMAGGGVFAEVREDYVRPAGPGRRGPNHDGPIIDADYERIDNDTRPGTR